MASWFSPCALMGAYDPEESQSQPFLQPMSAVSSQTFAPLPAPMNHGVPTGSARQRYITEPDRELDELEHFGVRAWQQFAADNDSGAQHPKLSELYHVAIMKWQDFAANNAASHLRDRQNPNIIPAAGPTAITDEFQPTELERLAIWEWQDFAVGQDDAEVDDFAPTDLQRLAVLEWQDFANQQYHDEVDAQENVDNFECTELERLAIRAWQDFANQVNPNDVNNHDNVDHSETSDLERLAIYEWQEFAAQRSLDEVHAQHADVDHRIFHERQEFTAPFASETRFLSEAEERAVFRWREYAAEQTAIHCELERDLDCELDLLEIGRLAAREWQAYLAGEERTRELEVHETGESDNDERSEVEKVESESGWVIL